MEKKYCITSRAELCHYGVKGMKWGVRRYQNKDGTLTNAGKKRLAKSIQREYPKDTTNEGYKRLVKSVSEELTGETGNLRINERIDDIIAKKKFLNRVQDIEDKYFSSDECRSDRRRAYDETVKLFEKDDPEYLQQIIDKNNGDKSTLSRFHDFATTQESFDDRFMHQGLRRAYKLNNVDPDEAFNAYSNYAKACNDAAEAVVGKYGKMKVPKEYAYQDDTTVNQIVSAAIRKLADDKDKTITDYRERHNQSTIYNAKIESAQKHAADVKAEINSKVYTSKEEKRNAINKAFQKKLSEIEKKERALKDTDTMSEELWQQWMFALDELDD